MEGCFEDERRDEEGQDEVRGQLDLERLLGGDRQPNHDERNGIGQNRRRRTPRATSDTMRSSSMTRVSVWTKWSMLSTAFWPQCDARIHPVDLQLGLVNTGQGCYAGIYQITAQNVPSEK